MAPVAAQLDLVRDTFQNDGEYTSIFARIRSQPYTSTIQRRTVMLSIPNTYAGPHTSPGVVVGAVFAAAGAFILIFAALFITFGRNDVNEVESVIVSESTRSRRSGPRSRSRARSRPRSQQPPRRRTPEVVEVRRTPEVVVERVSVVTTSDTSDSQVIEVYEDDSFDESDVRPGPRGGYRSVEPSEYGGRRPRNYRRG